MRYQLMCKDSIRAEFQLQSHPYEELLNLEIKGTLPTGCTRDNLFQWLRGRNATRHRKHLQNFLKRINCDGLEGFLQLTHGISINDCFWVRPANTELSWTDVSPYDNDYDEAIQRYAFNGVGLYGEQLSSVSPEFGTNGAFEKCWVRDDKGIYLLKRGSDIAYNSGLEPYCEVLASQVFSKLKAGIPYKLIHYHGKVASKCRLFNDSCKSFIPEAVYGNAFISVGNLISSYDKIPGGEMLRRILICDAITLNVDRHAGNFGVLVDSFTNDLVMMAPGFDYNLALLPYATRDDLADIKNCIDNAKPKIGEDFIDIARYVLTSELRTELIVLKGIQLSLPFYDDTFPEERAKCMTALVNTQIDNILSKKEIKYPAVKVEGLSNCMKYRMRFHLTEEEWLAKVPHLCALLDVKHMDELEEAIKVFLN